jgi:hypothetical protein
MSPASTIRILPNASFIIYSDTVIAFRCHTDSTQIMAKITTSAKKVDISSTAPNTG